MAIILNQDEKDQVQQQQAAPAQAPQQAVGAAPGAAPKRQQGSGLFTNLNRYIDANKGNQAVAGAVGDLSGQADKAETAFTSAKSSLDAINPANQNQPNTDQVDSWLRSAASIRNLANTKSGDQSDTYQYLSDKAQAQQQNVNSWAYKGPTAERVNNVYDTAEKARLGAQKPLDLVSNNDNRAQYFKEKYNAGRGDYSGGQGRLDNFLTNNAGRDTFAAKKDALQNVMNQGGALQTKRDGLQGQIANNRASVDNLRNDYFSRLNQYRI